MKANRITAALAALLLAGCASTASNERHSPRKEIEVVSRLQIPAHTVYIGQVTGADTSELKDKARARGGDVITSPTFIGFRGLFQSDVYRYKR